MYVQAEDVSGEIRGFDICIVGAGAAGIPMAKRLIGSNKKVLLVVSGRSTDRGRPEDQRQNMYKGTIGDFLKKVDPIFLERSRLHMYGGTTNHFGFWSRPLDPIDYVSRPSYRNASWPFDGRELEPYYQAAHQVGHFGPFNYDDMSFWENVLYARCFSSENGALQGAIMHAQYEEALHDFQLQFGEELKQAENITVLFNTHLLTIECLDKSHVDYLHCATFEHGKRGKDITIRADNYVLVMGGIETVRLLKLSDDLGNNDADHLGRGFMVHPLLTNAVKVKFAEPVATDIRNFFREQQIRLQAPKNQGEPYTHIAAPLVNPEDIVAFDVFNAWGILVPKEETLQREHIGNFRIILRFLSPSEAIVNLNWEQVPNEESRITLNESIKDPVFNQSVTHLDWRLRDEDKRTAVRALELTEEFLRRHGAISYDYLTDLSGGAEDWTFPPHETALATGDHHMGAIRMSKEAKDGIVNIDSRLHTVDNLYIAGCSVFPTGGFANPTLTIVAMALRLADYLKGVKGQGSGKFANS
jgi:choline dehydrogenase-like flavoprotein